MSRKLVAYFSATGTTTKVAELLADAVGADIFEIQPEIPYTAADLDWHNKNSRSSIEMKDDSSRPAIASKRDNMHEYDTIFVGFPIWWYVAPTIINTFLESYDMTGKTIIPFATSGGSEIGDTSKKLTPSCSGAKLLEGNVFKSNVSLKELDDWSKSLGQFTRNYTQTVKRAADNKRRYAPGWVHSTCLLRGFPKGAAPHLAHDFAEQSVVCYTLCRRCPENTVAAGEGKGI